MASSAVSASGRAKKSAAGGMSGTSRKAASFTAASAAAAGTVSARFARQAASVVGRSFGTYSHTIRMLLRWPGTSSTVPKKVGTRNSPMSSRDRNDSSRLA